MTVSEEDRQAPSVLVLAAGQGSRMKSTRPKVLHEVMGRPILAHVLNAARWLKPAELVVVTGHGAEEVEAAAAPFGPVFARQPQPLGTGHAVACAREILGRRAGPVLVMPGDVPLISPQTLIDFLDAHRALAAHLSVLTVRLREPAAYGRVVRDSGGWLERIVEARDASAEELAIDEINCGFYVADGPRLFESTAALKPDNDQKELYLTDVVADFRRRGLWAAAVEGPDPLEVLGVNDRRDLAAVQGVLRRRINDAWLLAGVTMEDPSSAWIEAGARLGRDVVLGQGVTLKGSVKVGEGAIIGPYCWLKNVEVGAGARLGPHLALEGAFVPAGAVVGLDSASRLGLDLLTRSSAAGLRATAGRAGRSAKTKKAKKATGASSRPTGETSVRPTKPADGAAAKPARLTKPAGGTAAKPARPTKPADVGTAKPARPTRQEAAPAARPAQSPAEAGQPAAGGEAKESTSGGSKAKRRG
ncbi:MAG: NTP transferase domain-containing protein [Deltaproteobacteria bacterium]|jgi:bifunctional UDP-N-acetylglucosamine pyrophosphorylase/glucosamine-1-phosphate N-acetyltransferase|nr:NTP transferase domain-containing protein [Deltaproteobacteria bacterium]